MPYYYAGLAHSYYTTECMWTHDSGRVWRWTVIREAWCVARNYSHSLNPKLLTQQTILDFVSVCVCVQTLVALPGCCLYLMLRPSA